MILFLNPNYRMAGYGTMKRQTTALNLGFPIAFESAYKAYGAPPAFEPEPHYNSTFDDVGDDFQADYHEQKRKDAHYMANQKVYSTKVMNDRANVSHAGYYEMPKPVLGQRRYANPSYGANSYSYQSARQDQPGAPWTIHYTPVKFNNGGLQGGVLRSSAGQRYGKQILNSRIGQLNEIEKGLTTFSAASAGLGDAPKTKFPGATGNEFNNELTSVSLVELAQLLQSVLDSTLGNGADVARFEVKDSVRAFALIVRAATDNTVSDIANILAFIQGHSSGDGIVPGLNALLSSHMEYYDIEAPEEGEEIEFGRSLDPFITRVYTLKLFWEKIAEYLKQMLNARHENQPKRSILSLSKALVDKLGFTKFIKNLATSNLGNAAPIRPPPEFLDAYDKEEAKNIYSRAGRSGAFIHPRMSREDSEHGGKMETNPKDELDEADPNRNLFANSSGANRPAAPPGAKGAAVQGIAPWSGINQSEVKIGETEGEKEARNVAIDSALARDAVKAEEEAIGEEEEVETPADAALAKLYAARDRVHTLAKGGPGGKFAYPRKYVAQEFNKKVIPLAEMYGAEYGGSGWAEEWVEEEIAKVNSLLDERDAELLPVSSTPKAPKAGVKKM